MRVTIEHRETTAGVLGNHKDCYVDCSVAFSEEERAIIKTRDLSGEAFTIRASTPLPSKTQFFSTNAMRMIGRIMMVAGVIWGIAGGGTPTGLLFFVGAGLEIYGWIRTRTEDKRFSSDEQQITIKQLLNKPTFTVHAWNAAGAKVIEEEIRENLIGIKNLIQNSAELKAKQTFEL
jgi:hypothetical protein